MMSLTTARLFSFLLLYTVVRSQKCEKDVGKAPFEKSLIGSSAQSFGGCCRFCPTTTLEIKNWAIVLTVNALAGDYWFCDTKYAFAYEKADKRPVLYYTKPTGNVSGECNAKVQKINVWGSRRNEFKKLVNEAIMKAEEVRDFALRGCPVFSSMNFTLDEVATILKNDRVATFAINYLNSIAYRNFFCNVWWYVNSKGFPM